MVSHYISVQLQIRDFDLLRGLFDARAMNLRQITTLYFDDHKEAARKRVRRLKMAGLLKERPRLPQESAVLMLTLKAFQTLETHGFLPEVPRNGGWATTKKRLHVSEAVLQHELELLDLRISLTKAAANSCPLADFCTDPTRYKFQSRITNAANWDEVVVKPDAYVCLRQSLASQTLHHFFVELDRSTESLNVLTRKIACYADYYRTGNFAEWLGESWLSYKRYPFRVLLILRSANRRDNFAAHLQQHLPSVQTQVWLTTYEEFIVDPFESIWLRPLDYTQAYHDGFSTPRFKHRLFSENEMHKNSDGSKL